MPDAISNTSPLLYLHRIGTTDWLPALFDEIWTPDAVRNELLTGRAAGYDAPDPAAYSWLKIVNPMSLPSEWLASDLGAGELAAMALALEHPSRIVLLDDMLARRTAQAAGQQVWGTLRILLEAKAHGLTEAIAPHLNKLRQSGMWISAEIEQRILVLADE